MNKEVNFQPWSSNVNKALLQALSRRVPTTNMSQHLLEVVNSLMDALSKGEIMIDLKSPSPPLDINPKDWPNEHRKAVLKSGWLDGENPPMVLEKDQLYWSRWYYEMETLTQRLINRTKLNIPSASVIEFKAHKHKNKLLNKEQMAAIKAVKTHKIILLSGGPGTGKTSTILHMLEELVAHNSTIKIGLSAPTGKAARRLKETLHKGLKSIETQYQESIATIPCSTIHRLLEARQGGFKRNKSNLLTFDLLVIDEMSMVELSLMHALLEALPEKSQLILVGDPNQLPPVASGSIWHKLQTESVCCNFGKGAVQLKKLYRNRGSIAVMSNLLKDEGVESFWEHLNHLSPSENIRIHHSNLNILPKVVINQIKSHLKRLEMFAEEFNQSTFKGKDALSILELNSEINAESILKYLEKLMILCPKRHGLWGVKHVHRTLLGQDYEEGISNWPQGTPVMCEKNQPDLGLANGDIGVVIGRGTEQRLLFKIFSDDQKLIPRLIHPARVKELEPALAMTIHKAQGSEADQIMLLWPENYSKSFSLPESSNRNDSYQKRLLYTAITRAKKHIDLFILNKEVKS